MFNFFNKNDVDFKFADVLDGNIYMHYPPILAKDLKPLKTFQEEKYGQYNFPGCPGMHDYSRMGYIIPAWTNFHIKANKAGTVAMAGSVGEDAIKRGTPVKQPMPMDKSIVDGLFETQGGILHEIMNFPAPWKIMSKKNVSCLLLPAFYHSTFLDDLYVYPGIVDYKEFSVLNFVCAPKRPCEIEIKAGDPILHVIPVITNKDIVASYGPATTDEKHKPMLVKWLHEKNFYRRFYMIRKKYKLIKDSE